MILRLRPYFGTMDQREIFITWRAFCWSKNHDLIPYQFRDGFHLFDELHRQGVYHSEVAALFLWDEEHRDILKKILGADV